MRSAVLLLVATVAQRVTAHFQVDYPPWRADTLTNSSYSQYNYPCGGVPSGVGNRTDWPIDGGSVSLDLHHPWTYVFINLGVGTNTTNFNVSLTPQFINVTGSGNFCIPALSVPASVGVTDGLNASLQVVTSGASGSALYNCADITFRSTAKALSGGACTNTSTITAVFIGQSSAVNSSNSTNSTSAGKNAAPGTGAVSMATLAGSVAFAVAFAAGLSL